MSKTWDEVLVDAKPLFDFLARQDFFDTPYQGDASKHRVIFDLALAAECSTDDSGKNFADWQGLLDSATPAWPDMPRSIEKKILEVLDSMDGKNYSNVPDAPLIYNFQGDVSRMLHCYAYGEFPNLWSDVLQAYLDGGIPCGWEGAHPEGKMIVFSNRN